jgi:signal peptidase II
VTTSSRTTSKRARAGIAALAVFALDQATKIWAVAALSDGPLTIIDGFFRFALARNPGASFSLFTDAGQAIGVIALGVIVFVFLLVDRVSHPIDVLGLGLIMGGAAGNVADRIFRGDGFLDGAVVDFIDFDFFPSFNVADTAINIGVGLLLLGTFVHHRRHGNGGAAEDESHGDLDRDPDAHEAPPDRVEEHDA